MNEFMDIIRRGDTERERILFPTGILSLDLAIGHPQGIPGSNLVQLLGAPSSGKTTVAYMWLAAVQKQGLLRDVEIIYKDNDTGKKVTFVYNAVIVDNEASYDRSYAESLGVDTAKVLVVESDTVERAFDLTIESIKLGCQFVIVDSVNASMPEKEFAKGFTESPKMAATATIIDQLCKRLTMLARKYDAVCLLINQYRADMRQMSRSDKKAGGGWSLAYFTKILIEFTAVENKDAYTDVQAKVTKNKIAPAKKQTKFRIEFGKGVRTDMDTIMLAVKYNIVSVSGAWFYFGDLKAQGLQKATEILPIDTLEMLIQEQFTQQRNVLDMPEDEDEIEE